MERSQMTNGTSARQIIRDIRHSLLYAQHCGCTGFDCTPQGLAALRRLGRPRPRVTDPAAETLADIRGDLGECTRCPLSASRTHIVFGEGSAQARLVFVGEGPGADEDRSGRPFVGAAGQLLNRIIGAMQMTRDEVYICNVVKCRPPNNRNPESDEIQRCLPFLQRQLVAVNPRVVCALGSVAARTLLGTQAPLSRLRGRFHEINGLSVMPTFHPAYLLRNPGQKRAVWEDMQRIMQRLAPTAGPTPAA